MLVVLVILWMALHSAKIIFAVFVNLFIGLSITTAVGLMMVGSLNLLSVAFAVLFVGLGVDFGIQFSVRYRSERFKNDDLRDALERPRSARRCRCRWRRWRRRPASCRSCRPTTRASPNSARSPASACWSRFVTSITVLPALLNLLNPPGEKEPVGYAFLAPVDHFLEKHRVIIIVGTLLVAVAGLPLLYFLNFDFNPINLRSPKAESIATFLDLRKDPNTGANAIDVMTNSEADAKKIEARLEKVPEVLEVQLAGQLRAGRPAGQTEADRARRQGAQSRAQPGLDRCALPPTPRMSRRLKERSTACARPPATPRGRARGLAAARRCAGEARRVQPGHARQGPGDLRRAAEDRARPAQEPRCRPQPVSLNTLPPDLADSWKTKDGLMRVEALPRGDPNDNDTLRKFAGAVLDAEPNAIGGPVSILKSGETVVRAFIQAGICALIVISLLLWLALRRITDVLLTLVPLLVAGAVTLEICVLIGLPLNFANIVALPLLLGVGVAFKIYYVTAWRAGRTNLLQSSLTRAIFFSALTTATAFGSLWLSSHPGTASMGKLLALSLVTTLAAVLLFQPALMGKPRDVGE